MATGATGDHVVSINPDFGDWDPDDSVDHEPPDAEQVSMRMHQLRVEIDALTGALSLATWDDLSVPERYLATAIGQALVDWLVSNDPTPEAAANALHNVRRYIATSPLLPWDQLSDGDRQVGISLMTLIIDWLKRQGAL